MRLKVKWDDHAKVQLKEIYYYIRKDSLVNAEKVRKEIIIASGMLQSHPEKYPVDKYKLNNDGSYRAFEKHHYRIVYRISQSEIRILTVRHTKMNPTLY